MQVPCGPPRSKAGLCNATHQFATDNQECRISLAECTIIRQGDLPEVFASMPTIAGLLGPLGVRARALLWIDDKAIAFTP